MRIENHPTEAIIAVTLNCNARCVMCNIWKNKIINEVSPDFYSKLPSTLREINITGGEPFLRNDLPEIVRVMKETCQDARLLINTNGYLVKQIQKLLPKILLTDPRIAIRISLDGFGHTHTNIRRLPLFFEKAMESLRFLKKIGIKDLGISFTLMEQNKHELLDLYDYCEKNDMEFSLTVATDSPIYFGTDKIQLRPMVNQELKRIFSRLTTRQYRSYRSKNWIRAWFNQKLFDYMRTDTRNLSCSAGRDFFYLDSVGRVYACHLKPWLMGNLQTQSFESIFMSEKNTAFKHKVESCNSCWMVCSARSNIKSNLLKIIPEIVFHKLKSHVLS